MVFEYLYWKVLNDLKKKKPGFEYYWIIKTKKWALSKHAWRSFCIYRLGSYIYIYVYNITSHHLSVVVVYGIQYTRKRIANNYNNTHDSLCVLAITQLAAQFSLHACWLYHKWEGSSTYIILKCVHVVFSTRTTFQ